MKLIHTPSYDADIVVAGGGPAGAVCGYYLAKQGFSVILVDFQNFPRDKVCGDFVGPVAIRELENMGIDKLNDFQQTQEIRQAAVFLNGEELLTKNIPKVHDLPEYGRVIPRADLDQWILQAAIDAGVKLITPCRLNDYTIYENSVVSQCKHHGQTKLLVSRVLIGADGSSSTVARIFHGTKPDPFDRIVAVRGYYENIRAVEGQAELYFTSKSFPGYYWFFPTSSTTANVGVGMVLENFPHQEINLKELLLDLVENDETLEKRIGHGKLKDKVVGWPLSTYNPGAKLAGDRLLLIGDAAGLINSLNGEGIQYAMQSGRWAAEFLGDALRRDELSAQSLQGFERIIKDRIGYDMSLANLVIQFIRNRNLNPSWLKMLSIMSSRAKKDEAYGDIAGGVLAGLLPANEALHPSFIGKTALETVGTLSNDLLQSVRNGPFALAGYGMSVAVYSVRQARYALDQREDYWNWIRGLAGQGINISGHVFRDLVRRG